MSIEQSLERLDDELTERGIVRASLAPDRARATSLVGLAGMAQGAGLDEASMAALGSGLESVVRAIAKSFPDNLLWDLDAMVGELTRAALASKDAAAYLDQHASRATELMTMFGRESTIRFRYIHDFVYGYDWVKWVRREVLERRQHGPFSTTFLDYTLDRGRELLELIDQNDRKYHQLAPGEVDRNPFGFSREPHAEIALHEELARTDVIPVEAWRFDAEPRCDRDFAALRHELAMAMRLLRPNAATS
jgi:hypothetical protein